MPGPLDGMRVLDFSMAIAGVDDREWPGFIAAIERPELENDPRFADGARRTVHLAELFTILDPLFETRTTADRCTRMRAAGQRYAPVNDYPALAEYEQAYANGYLVEHDHPEWGHIRAVGNPVKPERHARLPRRLGVRAWPAHRGGARQRPATAGTTSPPSATPASLSGEAVVGQPATAAVVAARLIARGCLPAVCFRIPRNEDDHRACHGHR